LAGFIKERNKKPWIFRRWDRFYHNAIDGRFEPKQGYIAPSAGNDRPALMMVGQEAGE